MKVLLFVLLSMVSLLAQSQAILTVDKATIALCLAKGQLDNCASLGTNGSDHHPTIYFNVSLSLADYADSIGRDCMLVDNVESFLASWLEDSVTNYYGWWFRFTAWDDPSFKENLYSGNRYITKENKSQVESFFKILPFFVRKWGYYGNHIYIDQLTLTDVASYAPRILESRFFDLVACIYKTRYRPDRHNATEIVHESNSGRVSHYYPPDTDFSAILQSILADIHRIN